MTRCAGFIRIGAHWRADRQLGTATGVSPLAVGGWLVHRGSVFILGFGLGCLWSSIYGFLAAAWPFGVLEGGV
jgi:hypothetical protein